LLCLIAAETERIYALFKREKLCISEQSDIVIFTTHDYEFSQTVANRVIELTPNGAIDRYMTFDDYLDDEKIQELRVKMYS